jgi:prepilin-type N-terminal cleavage/methylation domain-containing protein
VASRSAPWKTISEQQGFTLLEMLMVISLLAAVAFVATTSYRGVLDRSNEQLVYTEMKEIATAIRRFKQDTGYYPREGPFGLAGAGLGTVSDAEIQVKFPHAGATAAARARWFNSPANFYQILSATGPLATGQLATWNPETGRGWRGPYLTGFAPGTVDIGDGINAGPWGDPLAATTANVPDVDGLADRFVFSAVPVADAAVDQTLLDWSRTARPNRIDIGRSGRPYLFFAIGKGPDGVYGSADDTIQHHLVSMGPDGVYGTNDDIDLSVE